MICKQCGHQNTENARFCVTCGTLLGNICPRCASANALDARFCGLCGAPLRNVSDLARMVALARRKDNATISRLYEMTNKRYMQICRQILASSRTSGEMEDVLQDSYIKIFTSLDKLEDPDSFVGWGARIVTNTALDQVRKKAPVFMEKEDLEAAGYNPQQIHYSFNMDPGTLFDERETSRLVAEMVSDLSEPQRQCIYLFYMQEMPVRDIAQHLGVSENTVKSRLKYGRSSIEKKVLMLEKRGTKLYGLAPMPFFLLLFSKASLEAEASVVVSGTVRAAVLGNALLKGASASSGVAHGAGTGKALLGSKAAAGGKAAHGTGTGKALLGTKAAAGGKAAGSAASASAAAGGGAAVGGGAAAGSALAVKVAAGIAAAAIAVGGAGAAIRSLNSGPTVTPRMKAYTSKIEELEDSYGEARRKNSDESGDFYLEGLCSLGLLDFDGDGQDELLTVHTALQDNYYGEPYPGVGNYCVDIWTWQDGEVVPVLYTYGIGVFYDYNFFGSWTGRNCGVSVVEDMQGRVCVQLYQQLSEEGNSVIILRFYSQGDIIELFREDITGFYIDGQEVEKEEWVKEAGISRLLYAAVLSGEDSIYADEGDYWGLQTVEEGIEDVKAVLKGKRKKETGAQGEWVPIYLDAIMECDTRNHISDVGAIVWSDSREDICNIQEPLAFQDTNQDVESDYGINNDLFSYQYSLYDLDRDGVPELFARNKPSEAGSGCFVYTVEEHQLKYLGNLPYAHIGFLIGEEEGILSEWTHMGGHSVTRITLKGGELVEEAYDLNDIDRYPMVLWGYNPANLYPFWKYIQTGNTAP